LSALLSLLLVACGGFRLESGQRDRPITIDGKADEWRDSLTVIKDAQIAVGLFNDQENFYVCISSWNDDVNLQALNLGLTVWFDPGGGGGEKVRNRVSARGRKDSVPGSRCAWGRGASP